jgi:sec-independent protein translocase protein TatA
MGLDNPIHIAFLLILLLLVFGAKRLPEMGRSLGDGMRGFKDALSGQGTPFAADAAGTATATPTLTAHAAQPVAPVVAAQAAQPLTPVAAVQTPAQPLEQVPAA